MPAGAFAGDVITASTACDCGFGFFDGGGDSGDGTSFALLAQVFPIVFRESVNQKSNA